MPFTVGQLVSMTQLLRDTYISIHMEKHLPFPSLFHRQKAEGMKPAPWEWQCLKQVGIISHYIMYYIFTGHTHTRIHQCAHQLLCQLYERDSRRPFCPPNHWEVLTLHKIPPELFLDNEEGKRIGLSDISEVAISQYSYAVNTHMNFQL